MTDDEKIIVDEDELLSKRERAAIVIEKVSRMIKKAVLSAAKAELDITITEPPLEINILKEGENNPEFTIGSYNQDFAKTHPPEIKWTTSTLGYRILKESLNAGEVWERENTMMILGYQDENEEWVSIGVSWGDSGTNGEVKLTDHDDFDNFINALKIRVDFLSKKFGKKIQVIGWYHSHPPTRNSIGHVPEPGTQDMNLNDVLKIALCARDLLPQGFNPAMLIGRKNETNGTKSMDFALWRTNGDGKFTLQPGLKMVNNIPKHSYDLRYYEPSNAARTEIDKNKIDFSLDL